MDEQDIRRAFQSWTMAILERLQGEPLSVGESIKDLARQYGRHVTTPEALEVASRFFDWDAIKTYLLERPIMNPSSTNVAANKE